jgi:hypothetical protein
MVEDKPKVRWAMDDIFDDEKKPEPEKPKQPIQPAVVTFRKATQGDWEEGEPLTEQAVRRWNGGRGDIKHLITGVVPIQDALRDTGAVVTTQMLNRVTKQHEDKPALVFVYNNELYVTFSKVLVKAGEAMIKSVREGKHALVYIEAKPSAKIAGHEFYMFKVG